MNRQIFVLLFLLSGILNAQSLKHANSLFEEMNYGEAAQVYEDYLAISEGIDIEALKKAGDSHFFLGENRKALKWYEELYQVQGKNMGNKYLLRYIQVLRGIKDYEKADELSKVYLERKNDPALVESFLAQKAHLELLKETESAYTLSNLTINGENSDFGAAFYGEEIVYSSTKNQGGKLYVWNKQPFLDLYVAKKRSDGSLFDERPFLPGISSKYHDATISFTRNLDTVYYSTNIQKKNRLFSNESGVNNFHLLRGIIEDNEVTRTEELFFNSPDYSVGHPAISKDGKLLFFVSDMPGGFGETDIYVVKIHPDGTMSTPENLGKGINTEGREMFPYFIENTLFFSSDGHYGLGGLDIFSSKMTGELEFEVPKNVGTPVNSNKDDFSFIIDPVSNEGYLSSNRSQGKGDDDIYYFTRTCRQIVKGIVTDSRTGEPLENAVLNIYDQFNDNMGMVSTDSIGEYFIELPCKGDYLFAVSDEAYTTVNRKVSTTDTHEKITEENFSISAYNDLVERAGDKEKIKVNPIYFDYNKAEITEAGAKELDKVKYVMQEFPEIKIRVESHTDSRGTDSFNLKLSQARAEATKEYLISNNIAPERIVSARGYGEIEIRNECVDGVDCPEEDHLKNRRSEFIIIKE